MSARRSVEVLRVNIAPVVVKSVFSPPGGLPNIQEEGAFLANQLVDDIFT